MQRAPAPSADVPPKFLRKYQPALERIRTHKLLTRYGHWLQHPNLWHLNRRSVPGAVAIGLFAGLVPGPLQMLTALLIAVPCRKNVPVALLVTLYTNPFTIVPLYLAAYGIGRMILGLDGHPAQIAHFEMNWSDLAGSWHSFWAWLYSLGKPLAVGLPTLAVCLAVIGYFAADIGWRLHVRAAWRRRRHRR
jgi:uncharacterized protein (DUF2062 family)